MFWRTLVRRQMHNIECSTHSFKYCYIAMHSITTLVSTCKNSDNWMEVLTWSKSYLKWCAHELFIHLYDQKIGKGFAKPELSVFFLWRKPWYFMSSRFWEPYFRQHGPGDRNSIHRKPRLPHFTDSFVWDVPCLTMTLQGQKLSQRICCLSKKWCYK